VLLTSYPPPDKDVAIVMERVDTRLSSSQDV
jgi:hypothetical protein